MNEMRMFPATVGLPDGQTVTPALLHVQDGVVYVFATRDVWPAGLAVERGSNRMVVFRSAAAGPVGKPGPPPASALTIATDDGLLEVAAGGGCGCNHPLKRWRPKPRHLVVTL